jgi:hypothetical protein
MPRVSCAMASSSRQLTPPCNSSLVLPYTKCNKLRTFIPYQCNNMQTKLYLFPLRLYLFMKLIWRNIWFDGLSFGKVRLSHAQRFLRNGVIVIPPHDFRQLCRWYYRMWKVAVYEFSFITSGIMCIQNFIDFLSAITYLWNSHWGVSGVKGFISVKLG